MEEIETASRTSSQTVDLARRHNATSKLRQKSEDIGAQRGNSRMGWTTESPPPDPIDDDVNSLAQKRRQVSLPNVAETTLLSNNEDNKSGDDSSSQTSSLKLRRPSDMTTQFRQRIRQQAKQMVQKKRGSAQLAKRLLRNHSLQQQQLLSASTSSQDAIDDHFVLDKQIEESIKLGSKYTKHEHSLVPPEHIQRIFFHGDEHIEEVDDFTQSNLEHLQLSRSNYNSERIRTKRSLSVEGLGDKATTKLETVVDKNDLIFVEVVHEKPHFTTKKSLEEFAHNLTVFEKKQISFGLVDDLLPDNPTRTFEDSLFSMEPIFFAARSHRDYSTLIQRFGSAFLANSKQNILGLENIVTNCIEKVDRNDDDEDNYNFFEFRKPSDAKHILEQDNIRQSVPFAHLEIDLNRIEFEHHWLFSCEDAAARQLRSLYEEYSVLADNLIAIIRKYLMLKQKEEIEHSLSADDYERLGMDLAALIKQINDQKGKLQKISKSLDDSWSRLKDIRASAKFSETNLVLQQTTQQQQLHLSENGKNISEELQEIFNFPTYILNEADQPTTINTPSRREMERLEAVKKCRIQIQIYFNNLPVCTTSEALLHVDAGGGFSATFGRIFTLHVCERLEVICLKIRECFGGIGSKWYDLAQVYLPVASDTFENFPMENEDETSKNKMEIGSAKTNQIKNGQSRGFLETEMQQGENATSLSNLKSLYGMQFASDLAKAGHKGSLGCGREEAHGKFICGKLYCKAKWQKPYTENDEMKYKQFMRSMANEKTRNEHFKNTISLIPECVLLVSEEEFESALLTRRLNQSQSASQPLTYARQFSASQRGTGIADSLVSGSEFFNDDFATLSSDNLPILLSAGVAGELSLDAYRRIGHAYAVLMRQHLFENFALEQRLKTYSEIVFEESLPTLFRTFGTLFTPPDLSRKLKPMRLSSIKRNQQNFRNMYKLLVNIQSATNLPQRISSGTTQVFAEASFQKSNARTTVVPGRQPNWQETLTLNISDSKQSVRGQSTSSLNFDFKNILDCLEINIFDQIVTPLVFDDREPNTFHEQVEYRWLGFVRIPFATIYSSEKIDGRLTLKCPLFLSGYKITEVERYATIKLLVTIDPPVMVQRCSSNESFTCGETDEKLFTHCKKWESRMQNTFPKRRFVALANDSNGKRIIASRFLQKIPPPPSIAERLESDLQSAVLACIDLVASIPFVNDSIVYPGVCDIWTSADEMLKIGCGSIEEHAILLTCWILSMNLSAFLVLGHGFPEGLRSAYVLVSFDQTRRDSFNDSAWLINPVSGDFYFLNDPTIPFQVGTIITPTNAFGNINKNITNPSQLDFDIKKRSNWEPLFAQDRSNLVSVQTNTIRYVNVFEDLLTELRANLEREIKFNFDEARPYGIPQWNLSASRILRDILNDSWNKYIYDTNTNTTTFSSPTSRGQRRAVMLDFESKLEILRAAYNVQALGFRCAYTSKHELVERVLNLRVHINSDLNAQFALAINVQPFVNQIVCVSIALATLVPFNPTSSSTANW